LQQVVTAIAHVITDAFGLVCFAILLALPWRFAAALVMMAADKNGRDQHKLKSSAKQMCHCVGYFFSRMPDIEAATAAACRASLFMSSQFQRNQLSDACIETVHCIDALCGDDDSKFSKSNCPPKVMSAMTFIVSAVRFRLVHPASDSSKLSMLFTLIFL
jgi:hypothetical protein